MKTDLKTNAKLDLFDNDRCVIIDDLVPVSLQNDLETLFRHGEVNWKYVDFTAEWDDYNQNVVETPQFVHVCKNQEIYDLPTFYLQCSLLYLAQSLLDFEVQEVERIKNNCTLQHPGFKGKHHPLHTDHFEQGYYTLLYYISDSDGPTVFTKPRIPNLQDLSEKNMKIIKKVEPKKGRMVIFPANMVHAGSCPIEYPSRFVTNIVFKSRNLHEKN